MMSALDLAEWIIAAALAFLCLRTVARRTAKAGQPVTYGTDDGQADVQPERTVERSFTGNGYHFTSKPNISFEKMPPDPYAAMAAAASSSIDTSSTTNV